MSIRLLRPTFVFATVFGLAAVAVAAPKWHTLQAPHCLIVSQLPERETRAWATQFEQFTAAVRGVIVVDDTALPPLTVVLFAKTKEFEVYCDRTAEGQSLKIDGFFGSLSTWSVIGLAESFDQEATRRIIFHESTHWLLTSSRTEVPLWLGEGFAELFSTFAPGKESSMIGLSIGEHIARLQSEEWVPFADIIRTTATDPLYTDSTRGPLFYAESWLFVHRLLRQNPTAGVATLNRFTDARAGGAGQTAAFAEAFGGDLAAIQNELVTYAHIGRFTYLELPTSAATPITARFERASPLAVETTLARLALVSNRRTLARSHIDRALALAPTDCTPQELLAVHHGIAGDLAAAATAAQRAIDRGSRDAWMHIIIGNSSLTNQIGRGTIGIDAREVAKPFVEAGRLQPRLRAAYDGFAQAAPKLDDPTADDAQFLAAGCRFFPDDAGLFVGLAALRLKLGDSAEALRLLEIARSRPHGLDAAQQVEAEFVQAECTIAPRREHIDRLTKAGKFREALAECQSVLADKLPLRMRQGAEQYCRNLEFEAAVQAAKEAADANRPDEALHALEFQSTRSDLSQLQRNRLEKVLPDLKRRRTENDIFARWQAIQKLNTTGHHREAVAACDAILAEDLTDGWRKTIAQLREQSLANVGFAEAQLAADAGHRDEAIRLLEKLVEEDRTAGKETAVLESILSALRQNRPWPEIYRATTP